MIAQVLDLNVGCRLLILHLQETCQRYNRCQAGQLPRDDLKLVTTECSTSKIFLIWVLPSCIHIWIVAMVAGRASHDKAQQPWPSIINTTHPIDIC